MRIPIADEEFGHAARRSYGVSAFSDLATAEVRSDVGILSGQRTTASLRYGAVVGLKALKRRRWRVDNVHTLGFGPGRTGCELGRIGYVSGSSQCSQGLECSSSPTSGTHNPSSEGFLLLMC